MTLRRVFDPSVRPRRAVHRDGVGATAADDRVHSSHLTSRDDESILAAAVPSPRREVHCHDGCTYGRNRNGRAPRTGQPTHPL
jgi:hypothetical protein